MQPTSANTPRTASDIPASLRVRYLNLGDDDVIGASCHYLELADTGIVLDAGMDPEEDGFRALPAFKLLDGRPVEQVIVTHAHHDHLGALPVLIQRFPQARVHVSGPTARLADILLPSSARLQKRRLREGSSTAAPVFDVETAEALSYLYETHPLDTDFSLNAAATPPGHAISARLYHAGHVLGAVGVFLELDTPDGLRRIFYTSDVSLQNQVIQPGAEFPRGPLDLLVLETTLGADPDAELRSRKATEKAFGEALARTIERGGVALVPVFALGRAQEVLAMVDRFKRRKMLPADLPVYTAGSMRALANVYDQTRHTSPRLDEDFEVAAVDQRRVPRSDSRLPKLLNEPGIFVVSSGMLFERTLSNKLATLVAGHEKHSIYFVGFSKEDSPGGRMLAAAQERARTGEDVEVVIDTFEGPQPLRCEVERYRFSGHAHRRDLLKVVEDLRPARVLLVHGDAEAKEWMADNIRFFHPETDVLIPAHGEVYEV
ncbi:MAG: MBL fold metallo-hydrolase [Bacteroidota bacterium]